jgi:hypothetical protein
MNRRFVLGAIASVAALVSGCATGPRYAEVGESIAPLAAGEGRIYFFRSNSLWGFAIQPDIRLNDVVVGSSKPGGFFYVDRPAGSYIGAATTETEKTLSFVLAAGETKYIRTSLGSGVLVGRIILDLEDPSKAQTEIESLSFTGVVNTGTK